MTEPSIGTPIPLGIVDAKGVHEINAAGAPDTINDQLTSLRKQVDDLRHQLATISRKTVASVEAHPLIAVAAVSIAMWALLGLTARPLVRRLLR